jgi:hypothetical protein
MARKAALTAETEMRCSGLFLARALACVAAAETGLCGGLEAKVAPHNGRNVIWVDGRPVPPLMYSGTEHSRDTWEGRPRRSLEEFTSRGYRIIQTDMWFKYSLRPDGSFDWPGIRKQLAGILDVDSNAMIVVRINVSAPAWWLTQNTGEVCRVTLQNPERAVFGGNRAESLASEKYATFARENLRRFLSGLAQTPESDRVIGFHIGGGVYGEWHYYGIYQEPDASEPMQRAFRAFALGKYGTLERINAAWRTAFRSEEEIAVPSYERRYETGDGDFRDPRKDRQVIDYYACQQAVVSSLVDGLARLTKETWPRPTLVGLFYGYFFGGWTVGAQASQADVATLFRSPYVDYFSGPYASRNMHGSGMPRTLTDSVALNGKLWLTEHDGGTHLGSKHEAKWPDIPRNESETIARMRRNHMYTFTEGTGQWWYDFGPDNRTGWWSTPAALAEAERLLELSVRLLEAPYSKPAEVLLVHDMAAFSYVRPAKADKLTFKLTEDLTDALLDTGAAIDRIFLMDLEKVDLAKYRLVIFGNTFLLDAAQRRFIKERVLTKGRSVVFLSGAGYIDGTRNDTGLISDVVGMNIAKAPGVKPEATVIWGGQTNRLNAAGVTSLFKVEDGAARTLGTYADGTVSAAVKKMNGATVYYFGLPPRTELSFFKTLLREAGVRTYVNGTVARDTVAVGGGVIAVYSVDGGERTILPTNGTSRTVLLPPFSCHYFDLKTGDSLNQCPESPSRTERPRHLSDIQSFPRQFLSPRYPRCRCGSTRPA